LLLRPERLALLRVPGPWLALGASLIAYSPVIVFNIRENFQTLTEASASGNWAPGDVAPGPAGTLAAVAQLGRSMLGGFDLNGPSADPVWILLSWCWALLFLGIAILPLASRWTGARRDDMDAGTDPDGARSNFLGAHSVAAERVLGQHLPGTIVLVALLGLPLFNRNWHGFLEARYLGYTLPLLYAAFAIRFAPGFGSSGVATSSANEFRDLDAATSGANASRDLDAKDSANPETPRFVARPRWMLAGLALLILLPAARGLWILRDGRAEQFDNRRLWSMHRQAVAAEQDGAAVYVDRELKQVAWRAGGQPRRGVEYLLTMDDIPYVQAPAEKMNHFLGIGDHLIVFLAGDTAEQLREWGHAIEAIDAEPRPGEEAWGLYEAPGKEASSEEAPRSSYATQAPPTENARNSTLPFVTASVITPIAGRAVSTTDPVAVETFDAMMENMPRPKHDFSGLTATVTVEASPTRGPTPTGPTPIPTETP
jgi:hypothetical protein